jgi:CBS domain-containing protein
VKATKWASFLGQIIAVFFIAFGLWNNAFTLALIGFFVFTTARSENSMVQLDALLQRFTAKDLLRRNFTRLTVTDWMQTPMVLLRQGLERHFLVFNLNDELVGALEEGDIVAAMKRRDTSAEIAKYIQKVELVHLSEPLQTIYYHFRQRGHSIVGVVDGGELIGVIDEEGLQHFLRLQASGVA